MIPYSTYSKQDSYLAKLPEYQASFNKIYGEYKAKANLRGRRFLLTKHEFRQQCERPCTFCMSAPTARASHHNVFNGAWEYNGLDRIDSSKGYIVSNIQPCCFICNQLKSNLDEEVFLNHIKKIVFLSYWLRPSKEG